MKLMKSKAPKEAPVKKGIPVILLNSGGFDSVVLAHEVNFLHPDTQVYNLFFDWGQKNKKAECDCSFKCAKKLGFTFVPITLPPFSWCDSSITNGKSDSQYVPLRNLVFLSYALSYAQSVGAEKVYCAFVNPRDRYYDDTSPSFVEKVNNLSMTWGIEVCTPFISYTKDTLLKSLARQYGIQRSEVHSCNFGDTPCGKCPDCEVIDEIFEDIQNHVPEDIFIDNQFNVTPEMVQAVKDSKVTSVKLYVNNSCQFQCKHCFIGDKKLTAEKLTTDEWLSLIQEMKEYGIKHIDFFGKEPLFSEDVFALLNRCDELGITTSLITNGVNVPKYIDQIVRADTEVTVSVEDLSHTAYRNKGNHIKDVIKLLVSRGVQVNASVDLSVNNLSSYLGTIKTLSKMGVSQIYVKPIRPFGAHEKELMASLLPVGAILKVVEDLISIVPKVPCPITLALSQMDLSRTYDFDPEKFNQNLGYAINNRLDVIDGLYLELELHCHRFQNSVAVTPDGYVVGCASEYCTDYSMWKSVHDHSFAECVNAGKDCLSEMSYSTVGCSFCKEYKKISEKIFAI